MYNIQILSILSIIINLLYLLDIYKQLLNRVVFNCLILGMDIFAAYVLGNIYIDTKNIFYLLPILLGIYCYTVLGFNANNNRNEKYWSVKNGIILGMTILSIKPLLL